MDSRPFSLAYSRRLHQRQEFVRFFENSEVARFRKCTVFRIQNQHGHFRLGMTFKIKCSSVERNVLKRALRERFRTLAPQLGSFDYNVVLRSFQRPVHLFVRQLVDELSGQLPGMKFQPAEKRKAFKNE